jgi:hypothetical protein
MGRALVLSPKEDRYRIYEARADHCARLSAILGLNFKDTQCGFKAFTRHAAETIFPLQQVERWGFDPEILYLAKKFKFKVVEVPVAWAHREGTRIDPLRDGIKMFGELVTIRWNALTGKYNANRK